MTSRRKWLIAALLIGGCVIGLPALIAGRWTWFLANPWDTGFEILWASAWIAGKLKREYPIRRSERQVT